MLGAIWQMLNLASVLADLSEPWGTGDAMAPPDLGRSVNPISTKRAGLCPRIFRPSYGPELDQLLKIPVTSVLTLNLSDFTNTQQHLVD